jgi:hypothetical protein
MCREQRPPNTYQVHLHLDCFDKNSDANFIIGIRFRKSTGQTTVYIRTTPAARCRRGLKRCCPHPKAAGERPYYALAALPWPYTFPRLASAGNPTKACWGSWRGNNQVRARSQKFNRMSQ